MILTVDELRAQVSSSLSDDALRDILDATEAEILARAPLSRTEYLPGGYAKLVLAYDAGVVSSVVEWWDSSPLTLAATDYLVTGQILVRLDTGTNPSTWWQGPVKVTYAPAEQLAVRKQAQVILVRRDLSVAAGVTSERIGDYSVGYGAASYAEQTAQAFALLGPVLAA